MLWGLGLDCVGFEKVGARVETFQMHFGCHFRGIFESIFVAFLGQFPGKGQDQPGGIFFAFYTVKCKKMPKKCLKNASGIPWAWGLEMHFFCILHCKMQKKCENVMCWQFVKIAFILPSRLPTKCSQKCIPDGSAQIKCF